MKEWPLMQVPDKTLLKILDAFQDQDLYTFALVSKRLHYLALPIIFRRHGFTKEIPVLQLTLPPDSLIGEVLLDALRAALFINPISLLEVRFKKQHLPGDFERVFHIISKVAVIRELCVTFQDPHLFSENRWIVVFDILCSTLNTKLCSRLQISRESHHDIRVYQHVPIRLPAEPRRIRGIINGFLGTTRKGVYHALSRFNASQPLTPEHHDVDPESRLALYSFELNDRQLFKNGIFAQILPSFSTLRTLKFDENIVGLKRSDLFRISAIAIELTTLVVNTVFIGLKATDLIDFASQFPKLKELIIKPWFFLWVASHKFHKFSSLTRLSAPPQIVLTLLAGGAVRALPNLQSLSLELFVYHEPSLFVRYHPVLLNIMSALRANPRTASILPTLSVDVDIDHYELPCMMATLDESLGVAVGGKTVFEQPTELIIGTGITRLFHHLPPDKVLVLLPRWLRIFKALRQLTFTARDIDPPIHTPIKFIRAIYGQCPDIQTVTIQGIRYNVSATFREEEKVISVAQQTVITDLPSHILYILFDYLDDLELYEFATTTRTIFAMALSFYLRRRRIVQSDAPSTAQFVQEGFQGLTDLSALRLSSSVHSIQHLSCRIPVMHYRFVIYEFLHRLRRLVLSLSSITRITLDFLGASFVPLKYHAGLDSKAKWMSLIVSLLHAISTTTCSSLTIFGGAFFNDLTQPLTISYNTRPHWIPPPPEDTKAVLARRLGQLIIDSEALDFAAIRYWMYFTLKGANHLTSLRVASALRYQLPELPNLGFMFRALTELHIACVLVFEYTTVLLHNLPCLTLLSLVGIPKDDIDVVEIDSQAARPALSSLKTLIAPAEYITFLLGPADALPSLDFVMVGLSFGSNDHTGFRLQLVSGIVDRLRERDCPPSIALDISIQCAEWMLANIPSNFGWQNDITLITLRELRAVRRPRDPAGSLRGLDGWLQWFPNLYQLSLLDGEGEMDIHVKEILDRCPSLGRIKVNGEEPATS